MTEWKKSTDYEMLSLPGNAIRLKQTDRSGNEEYGNDL